MKYTKDKFGVTRIDSKEFALLPISEQDDKVMPVTFQVIHDESSTATVILRPYVIIHNNTNQQINIDKKPLDINNYFIIKSVSPSLDVMIDCHGLKVPI